jgi:uncharacterized protein (TIGR03067 family)
MRVIVILATLLNAVFITGGVSTRAAEPSDKPNDQSPAAQAELKNLQGTWRVVRAENKGEDVLAKLGYEQFTVEGNTMRMVRNGEERKSTFEIDPSHDPKWITFTTPAGKQIPGIYELKGDSWKTLSSGRGRPANFEDKEAILMVYERAKDGAATTTTKPTTAPTAPK